MIGTISPSWKNFECKDQKIQVRNSMCNTCQAIGKNWGLPFRTLLSYDTIFLSLFSDNDSEKKSRSSFACIKSKKNMSDDDMYLSDISVFIGCTKLLDSYADGEIINIKNFEKKIQSICNNSAKKLESSGVNIPFISNKLQEYSNLEKTDRYGSFDELSAPISEAYGEVFSSLPSIKNSTVSAEEKINNLRHIGFVYGKLTLLIDAVLDLEDDKKTGSYNIWDHATDLPKDKAEITLFIKQQYKLLLSKAMILNPNIRSYLLSAQEKSIKRINNKTKPKNKGKLFSSLLPLLALVERDCNGDYHLTESGAICVSALFIVGAIACCFGCSKCCCDGCDD